MTVGEKDIRIPSAIGTALEARIPRLGTLFEGRTFCVQCWKAGYQGLATMLDGRIPRTGYSIGRQDTKGWLQCWKAGYQGLGTVLEGGGYQGLDSFERQDTKDWLQC